MKAAGALRLDKQRHDLRMQVMQLRFHLDHQRFNLRRAQVILKLYAHGRENLLRRQMHREQAVRTGYAVHRCDGRAYRIKYALTGPFANQQTLGFLRQDRSGDGENQADDDRGDAIPYRRVEMLGQPNAGERGDNAENGRGILQQHNEGRRILAAQDFSRQFGITPGSLELVQRQQPRAAFEDQRRQQDDISHGGVFYRFGIEDVMHAFVDRQTSTQSKDQHRHHETPEIHLTTIAQRMIMIGSVLGAMQAIEQQYLVAHIDRRVDALAEHGGTAGP